MPRRKKRRRFGQIIDDGASIRIRWRAPDGKRPMKVIGPSTPLYLDLAREELETIELEQRRAQLGGGDAVIPIRFKAFVDRYYAEARASRQAESTVERDLSRVHNRILPWFGRKYVHEIRVRDVARFRASIYADGRTHATVNRHIAVLSAILNEARRQGHCQENVADARHIPRERENEREYVLLSIPDQERLVAAMPLEIAPIVRVLLDTGMRPSEFQRLRWSDIRWGDLQIHIRETKVRKERLVPIYDGTVRALRELEERNTGTDRVSPYATLTSSFARYWRSGVGSARVGPGLTPYCLKHFCAANMARAGIPQPDIARLLGVTIKTAARYMKHSPKNYISLAREGMQRLHAESMRVTDRSASKRPHQGGKIA